MGYAKWADRSSLMRTKDDREPSRDILKKKGWKMPALERTLNIEGGHLDSGKNCGEQGARGQQLTDPDEQ